MRSIPLPSNKLLSATVAVSLAAWGCGVDSVDGNSGGATVAVYPTTALLAPSASQAFTAAVTGSVNTGVIWSLLEGSSAGTVTSSGLYTAPASTGQFHVIATSIADASLSASASVSVAAPPVGLAAEFDVLSRRSVFFGHRSIGSNTLSGVQVLLNGNTGPEPTLSDASPAQISAGVIAHALIGTNTDPLSKVNDFVAKMNANSAAGTPVGRTVQIALMKYCFDDFGPDAGYFKTGGTPATLFESYKSAIAQLKVAYPNVRFVHVTVPLYLYYNWAQNPRREAYNALVRQAYQGKEPLLDLALVESTRPDGTREIGADGAPALYPGYAVSSTDAHLNATGQDKAARAFVQVLANVP